ncbi:MAG: hypothetical protein IJJ77_00235 [Paludibacteraceae bacterium]|nr:hypothetical protein [Paludibacteraceae bacterium]
MNKLVFIVITVVSILFISCNSHTGGETGYNDSDTTCANDSVVDDNVEISLHKSNDGVWYKEYRNKLSGHIIRRKYAPTSDEIEAYYAALEEENLEEMQPDESEDIDDTDEVEEEDEEDMENHRCFAGVYKITENNDSVKYKLYHACVFSDPFIIKFDTRDDPANLAVWYGYKPIWLDGYKVENLQDGKCRLRLMSNKEDSRITDSIISENPDIHMILSSHSDNHYGLKPFLGKSVDARIDTTYLPDSLFIYFKKKTLKLDRIVPRKIQIGEKVNVDFLHHKNLLLNKDDIFIHRYYLSRDTFAYYITSMLSNDGRIIHKKNEFKWDGSILAIPKKGSKYGKLFSQDRDFLPMEDLFANNDSCVANFDLYIYYIPVDNLYLDMLADADAEGNPMPVYYLKKDGKISILKYENNTWVKKGETWTDGGNWEGHSMKYAEKILSEMYGNQ